MNVYEAVIHWFSSDEGGRKTVPPQGTKCFPMIRTSSLKGDWSIRFTCGQLDHDRKMHIAFSFISQEAPTQGLKRGTEFLLYEGSKKVAEGIII